MEKATPAIKEEREVWGVYRLIPADHYSSTRTLLEICEAEITASRRMNAIKQKENLSCIAYEIKALKAFKIEGIWYYPVPITPESDEDRQVRQKHERKEAVLQKAREMGLTDEEVALLT